MALLSCRRVLGSGLACLALWALPGMAFADFLGPYDLGNWTISTELNGRIDTTGAPSEITLHSADDEDLMVEFDEASNQDITIAAVADGNVNFSWESETNDDEFSYDPFGFLLNGVFTELTDPGAFSDGGAESFAVMAGDTFGFRQHSTDSCCGAAWTTVFNFEGPVDVPMLPDMGGDNGGGGGSPAPIPEPATVLLLGSGLVGLGAWRMRASRRPTA